MDIQFYNQIKDSDEYSKILKLGYFDITTPIQMRNGTLDFSMEPDNEWSEKRFSIYCDKVKNSTVTNYKTRESHKEKIDIQGALRAYSYSAYPFKNIKMYKIREMHISMYEDYLNAISELIKYINKRYDKYMNKIKAHKLEAFRNIFEKQRPIRPIRPIRTIKDLYQSIGNKYWK